MIQHYHEALLLKRDSVVDQWREKQEVWVADDNPIQIGVFVRTGSTTITNEVEGVQSSHIGLTKDKRAQVGDKIIYCGLTYIVDFIIETKQRQLFLNLEVQRD